MTSTSSLEPHKRQTPDAQRLLEESVASVREALSGLRFGSVSLTVHEGRVVQIDVTEKRRLSPGGSPTVADRASRHAGPLPLDT